MLLLVEMEADERQKLLDIIASLQGMLISKDQEITLLRQKVDLLIKKLFGSKSEALDDAQMLLLLDPDALKKAVAAVPDAPAASEFPVTTIAKTKVNRKPRLPDHLPVEEIFLDPEPVKACPEAWYCIGQEVSEQLDYKPGKFLRRRLIRRKYVKLSDRELPPVIADLPKNLQDACLATPGLIAEIIVNKYNLHLPLYRQEKMFKQRHRVEIPRQSMMNWEVLAADWLQILYRAIKSEILSKDYLQIDETPVRYQEPGNKKTKIGYFWVYRSRDGTVLYDWRPGRSHTNLDKVLYHDPGGGQPVKQFNGIIQSDGYAGYQAYQKAVASRGQIIDLAACWAHARRKFNDAKEQSPRLVGWILYQIQLLYRIETKLRNTQTGHALRQAIRASQSRMIYNRLGKALSKLEARRSILPKSNFGIAIRYTLQLWQRLGIYIENGQVEIDNNLVENAIRPTAVGKKNWLFIGREDTGEKAAIFYTLIANCKIHGIDPHAYFKDILERLPNATNHNVHEFLPAAIAANQPPRLKFAS